MWRFAFIAAALLSLWNGSAVFASAKSTPGQMRSYSSMINKAKKQEEVIKAHRQDDENAHRKLKDGAVDKVAGNDLSGLDIYLKNQGKQAAMKTKKNRMKKMARKREVDKVEIDARGGVHAKKPARLSQTPKADKRLSGIELWKQSQAKRGGKMSGPQVSDRSKRFGKRDDRESLHDPLHKGHSSPKVSQVPAAKVSAARGKSLAKEKPASALDMWKNSRAAQKHARKASYATAGAKTRKGAKARSRRTTYR
jgi:hypothetical protein